MFTFRKPAGPRVQPIAATDAIARADAGEITLIDVRDMSEINASGRARGAVHVPLMRLRDRADPRHPDHDPALAPERPVALYCASGARSQMAGEALIQLGYREVYNIGGLRNWAAAGGALTR